MPTTLEFDAGYDCMRVVAPAEADPCTIAALEDVGRRTAEHMGLQGLMDVEVVVQGLVPKVIEIDARLPSQTPTAVYHACDLNMVALMVEACVGGPAAGRWTDHRAGQRSTSTCACRGGVWMWWASTRWLRPALCAWSRGSTARTWR